MRRLSGTKEATFVEAVRGMLAERFPEAELLAHVPDGKEAAAVATARGLVGSGRNGGGSGDPCVYVAFPHCHASVVLENSRATARNIDPEATWNASVYWSQPATHPGDPWVHEDLILGMASLGDLLGRIGSELHNFEPSRQRHSICLYGIGGTEVSVEAVIAPHLDRRDHEVLALVTVRDADDALRIYGSDRSRSKAMSGLVREARERLHREFLASDEARPTGRGRR